MDSRMYVDSYCERLVSDGNLSDQDCARGVDVGGVVAVVRDEEARQLNHTTATVTPGPLAGLVWVHQPRFPLLESRPHLQR